MAFDLKKVLKALLYSSSEPLSVRDIQAAFSRFHASGPAPLAEGAEPADALPEWPELYDQVPELVTAAQIREAADLIAAELAAADDGLILTEAATGYRIATHPRFARWVRVLRDEPQPAKLTPSSLETLAVVAYRQPVTRAEIESVRGVSAEAGLAKLIERDLVAIVGRAELPGRPIQYGTTGHFLEFVGIRSIDELPASDVLSSRQIDAWLSGGTSGHAPTDADMGLDETGSPAPAAETPQATPAPEPAPEPAAP